MKHLLPALLLFTACHRDYLRASPHAPVEVGKLRSALWVDVLTWESPGYAAGDAVILLSDAQLGCDDLAPWLDYEFAEWEGGGLFAEVAWYATDRDDGDVSQAWEGRYFSGVASTELEGSTFVTRDLLPFLHQDDVVFTDLGGTGELELTEFDDEEVTGRITSPWVEARFTAEVCSAQPRKGGGGRDSGYYRQDTGYTR